MSVIVTPANANIQPPTLKRPARLRTVQPQLIKLADAAAQLGVSIDLIKDKVRDGTLRAITLSDGCTAPKYLFVAELNAFIEARLAKARGGAEAPADQE